MTEAEIRDIVRDEIAQVETRKAALVQVIQQAIMKKLTAPGNMADGEV